MSDRSNVSVTEAGMNGTAEQIEDVDEGGAVAASRP